jgi:hypothetical protein
MKKLQAFHLGVPGRIFRLDLRRDIVFSWIDQLEQRDGALGKE